MGEQGEEIKELSSEILENIEHPDRNPKPQERAKFLLKLARQKLDYIAQGVHDLQVLEEEGTLSLIESDSASRSEAGE